MKTDKQMYRIFAANPQWIFELTGMESPGVCELQAVALKDTVSSRPRRRQDRSKPPEPAYKIGHAFANEPETDPDAHDLLSPNMLLGRRDRTNDKL